MKLSFLLVVFLVVLNVALVAGGLYYLVSDYAALCFLLAVSLLGNIAGYCYMGKNAPLLPRDRRFNRFTVEWPNSWFSNRR